MFTIESKYNEVRRCNLSGAIANLVSKEGLMTLPYKLICQCNLPSAWGSITPLTEAIFPKECLFLKSKSLLLLVSFVEGHPTTARNNMSNF